MQTTKPLRVLFDAGPLIGNNRSGVGYYTQGLVSALAEEYPEHIQLTGYYFNFLGRKLITPPNIAPNITFKPIRYFPGIIISPLARILGLQLPIELFVFRKYDIQLFTNFVSMPSLRKTPQIITIHDLCYLEHPEYVNQKNVTYMRKLVGRCARRAKSIFAVSTFTKSRIQTLIPTKAPITVTHIPYIPSSDGADVNLSKRLRSMGLRPKAYLLYLGTIEPRKNITQLVEGYLALDPDMQKQFPLVLAGGKGWQDEEILETIKQAQAQGAPIIQTGYVSDKERVALYTHARAFTLASHYEGFGMPILEAMHHGIPVAVSDIPVFHEVAGDAALYYDHTNVQSIADTLRTALTDDTVRSECIAKGDLQAKIFTWQSTAQAAYNTMIEAAKG